MSLIGDFLLRPWLAIGTVLFLGVFLSERIRRFVRLRHIKGPLLSRITGIPHILAILGGESHEWYFELSKKYGDLVVLSPTKLLTSSPELFMYVNTQPEYMKSPWYYRGARFDWRIDNIFTQMDNAKHDARRKQMVRGYSGAENLTLEDDIEACMVKLLHLLRSRYAGQRRSLDLGQKILFFTMDVISTIGFGKCYNLLNADDDPNEYLSSQQEGLRANNRQIALGTAWMNKIPFLAPRTDQDIEKTKGFYRILAINAAMVEAREREFLEQKSRGVIPRADMLTSFMKNGLRGAELKAENVLQIVAGTDTTGGTLRGILLYVMTNLRVCRALQAEIDEAVASGAAPRAPGIIKPAQARDLPYLQAVIKESMRMYSPVNNQLGRDTPPGGDTVTINGEEIYLPGGVSIVPSFKAMHRNTAVYGEGADVDVFRPERWIEEKDEKKLEAMKQEVGLTFGHGSWKCLGQGIALRQLGVTVFELFRNFDWTMNNPEKPWKDSNYMGLHITRDMWVQVEERKHS